MKGMEAFRCAQCELGLLHLKEVSRFGMSGTISVNHLLSNPGFAYRSRLSTGSLHEVSKSLGFRCRIINEWMAYPCKKYCELRSPAGGLSQTIFASMKFIIWAMGGGRDIPG